jgi:hypothetical protein
MNEQENSPVRMCPVVEEQFLISKTGRLDDCEDALYIGKHFVAVIDGATSNTTGRWNGETSGKVAARLLVEACDQLPYDATARQAVDLLTSAIQSFYEHMGVVEIMRTDPVQRATASIVLVSLWRKEVWFIGDCQCLLDDRLISNEKLVDRIASEARAMFLETEILRGATIKELCQDDPGRAFIMPLLQGQNLFQNNQAAGDYWYAVIDGSPVPDEGIVVHAIPASTEHIVLATDGYPVLKSSLQASERALQAILADDPLLFRRYKTVKALGPGNVSFDDRAFVKFRLQDKSFS